MFAHRFVLLPHEKPIFLHQAITTPGRFNTSSFATLNQTRLSPPHLKTYLLLSRYKANRGAINKLFSLINQRDKLKSIKYNSIYLYYIRCFFLK